MECKIFWLLLFAPESVQSDNVNEAMRAHARACEPCRESYFAIDDALEREDGEAFVRIVTNSPIVKEAADETGLIGPRWNN